MCSFFIHNCLSRDVIHKRGNDQRQPVRLMKKGNLRSYPLFSDSYPPIMVDNSVCKHNEYGMHTYTFLRSSG